ncbi:SymE family type I addiction module toxin [Klebsiella aerogenes]|uniref:SymE family type I addiction module toxin n=1 Tax=Klebsiella aerogenes TaxID=548 RepID=UPI001CC30BD0|nr:SymE family type I addiction module toxin [Klebsiella aerogenes]MEC4756940.1 SymE family type I addiction module toxin [Klebsiella aerogenes]
MRRQRVSTGHPLVHAGGDKNVWLEEAGFSTSPPVTVIVEHGLLVIRLAPER